MILHCCWNVNCTKLLVLDKERQRTVFFKGTYLVCGNQLDSEIFYKILHTFTAVILLFFKKALLYFNAKEMDAVMSDLPGQPMSLEMPPQIGSVCQLLEHRMQSVTRFDDAVQLFRLAVAQAKRMESQLDRANEVNTDLNVKLRALEYSYAGVRRTSYAVIGGIGAQSKQSKLSNQATSQSSSSGSMPTIPTQQQTSSTNSSFSLSLPLTPRLDSAPTLHLSDSTFADEALLSPVSTPMATTGFDN